MRRALTLDHILPMRVNVTMSANLAKCSRRVFLGTMGWNWFSIHILGIPRTSAANREDALESETTTSGLKCSMLRISELIWFRSINEARKGPGFIAVFR